MAPRRPFDLLTDIWPALVVELEVSGRLGRVWPTCPTRHVEGSSWS